LALSFNYEACHKSVLCQRSDVQFVGMVALVALADVDATPALALSASCTTSRKYVTSRPRICHAKQSRRDSIVYRKWML